MSFRVVRWWTGGIPWSSRSPAYIPPGLIGAPICLVTCHTHPDRQPIEYAAARFFGYAVFRMRDFLDARFFGCANFWTRNFLDVGKHCQPAFRLPLHSYCRKLHIY